MSNLILYDYGSSVCCQKVRITLVEKGLSWEARRVDLFKAEQFHPEYLKLNPKGVVPTLVHNGVSIIESTLICEYIDEVFAEPPLIPKAPAERAQMRVWSKYVDEGLFDGVAELSFSAMFRERMRSMTPELRAKRFANVGDPRRRDRMMSTYDYGVQSPYVLHGIAAYERAFKHLEDSLTERGPWILGKMISLADINLMPFVARLEYLGLIGVWIDKRPRAREWWIQVQNWPSFKRGLRDLHTSADIAEMGEHGPKIRDDVAKLRAGLL
jgi:glutathione S-transferase